MTLYLDSAFAEDATRAFRLGLVRGITTNPTLLAKVGKPAEEVIPNLCDIATGWVFYQPNGISADERETQARKIVALRPDRIGLKIPCTLENLAMTARLTKEGFTVGVTAIFSPAQVYLSCQAGAHYVLPYANRSTRLQGDGLALIHQMRAVIEAEKSNMEIIAASIKTPEEAVAVLLAGAHHLTIPLAIIMAMGDHPLSDQAIDEFSRAG